MILLQTAAHASCCEGCNAHRKLHSTHSISSLPVSDENITGVCSPVDRLPSTGMDVSVSSCMQQRFAQWRQQQQQQMHGCWHKHAGRLTRVLLYCNDRSWQQLAAYQPVVCTKCIMRVNVGMPVGLCIIIKLTALVQRGELIRAVIAHVHPCLI